MTKMTASLWCVSGRWLRHLVAPAALDNPPAKQELPQAFVKTKVSENFRENYRNSFGPSFPGMACQTLFFRILPAPKNTLFCLCFGAPQIF